jgi:hypothetical protein
MLGRATLRGLSRGGRTWTAWSVINKSGHMTAERHEAIVIAWYGSPARFR